MGPRLTFESLALESIPPIAKTYLSHAIALGTPLASAVRLTMTGEIKLKKWMPFTANQVVRADCGFVWCARVKNGPVFITGFDQFIDGVGQMQWKLLGLIPIMTGSGPDITRSAGDRYSIERILLPSSCCRPTSAWKVDGDHLSIKEPGMTKVELGLNPSGRVESVSMLRWGNPDSGVFELNPFGGHVDAEETWEGYTIPSQFRIGWHFGSDQFDTGEFFRATITHAEFR